MKKRRSWAPGAAFVAPVATASNGLQVVKVCGIASRSDAQMVTDLARTILPPNIELYLGMILWPRSRRSISPATASGIAEVAAAAGATPVAVFVDEHPSMVASVCNSCGIQTAQLHGPRSRAEWATRAQVDDFDLQWIDVRDVIEGEPVTAPTKYADGDQPLWTLFDAKGGGTGIPFDWNSFTPPTEPWLLAGGLHADNVAFAVSALCPTGLDVASGVAGPDRVAKDPDKVRLFLERAVDAYRYPIFVYWPPFMHRKWLTPVEVTWENTVEEVVFSGDNVLSVKSAFPASQSGQGRTEGVALGPAVQNVNSV